MSENVIIISDDDGFDSDSDESDVYNNDKCGFIFKEPDDYYEEMAKIDEVEVVKAHVSKYDGELLGLNNKKKFLSGYCTMKGCLDQVTTKGKKYIYQMYISAHHINEFFMGLNVTSHQKKLYKKAFNTYYDVSVELLQCEHTIVPSGTTKSFSSLDYKVIERKYSIFSISTTSY
ncbi:RNA binding protein [Artemisia annua]|uniref:RNA binding protein n=1 Tax=Artemisia annua TaxID=35608 RepID=A0A2U1KX09_ARTAN|nr:RNA binding protein [Artemisia annua]